MHSGRSDLVRLLGVLTLITAAVDAEVSWAVADTTSCQVQDYWIVNGQMGDPNKPGSIGRCQTEVMVAVGDLLHICAKGTVELQSNRQNGPAGDPANQIAPGSYWLPGKPEGALIGCIKTAAGACVPVLIGDCHSAGIPAAADGILMLGINDEYYVDNTGSFKVKGYNVANGVGNIDPATAPRDYVIIGASTGVGWTFGMSLNGSDAPANPGPLTSTRPGEPVPPAAAAFGQSFIAGIKAMNGGPDPDCICALPSPTVGLRVIAGRNNPPVYDLWILPPGVKCNTAAAPVAPPLPPALPVGAGCAFNPTLVLLGGASYQPVGTTGTPALQETGIVLLVILLLSTGAYLVHRKRSMGAAG